MRTKYKVIFCYHLSKNKNPGSDFWVFNTKEEAEIKKAELDKYRLHDSYVTIEKRLEKGTE